MDIRHPLQHFDVMMLEWAYSRQLFVHVMLTKADKLNRGPASKVLLEVQEQLKKMKLHFSIQLFSALHKIGLEELASIMAGRLNYTLEQPAYFDLDSIPEASEDDIDLDDDSDLAESPDHENDEIQVKPE
ncbi:MAG: YihA family ribosome biogenesis GTP-binding protein, partial [Acinetobacter sp.]|nr:YihA family ribosome biogenesis GTP-binding protein [Acinetobacter sp.]